MLPLALDTSEKYVAGAYLVFLALILIYVSIMAVRLERLNRDMDELLELAEDRPAEPRREEVGAP